MRGDLSAPFPERGIGPPIAEQSPETATRPRGRGGDDYTDTHLRCERCGALWAPEIMRMRFEMGADCLCGGELTVVVGPRAGSDGEHAPAS